MFNWQYVYKVEKIPSIAKIKGRIKDFLQYFIVMAVISIYYMYKSGIRSDVLVLYNFTKIKSLRNFKMLPNYNKKG